MALSVTCICGKIMVAREQFAGKKAKCPNCGAIVEIPGLPGEDNPAQRPSPHELTATPLASTPMGTMPHSVPRRSVSAEAATAAAPRAHGGKAQTDSGPPSCPWQDAMLTQTATP